jgi:hypothetical protein
MRSFLAKVLAQWAAAGQGLKVKEFHDWHPALDDALAVLPETELLSHELFRLLAKNPCPTPKRMVLVLKGREPVAVAGLRWLAHQWEPLTNWIVPGVLFPVKDGYVHRVLPALGVSMYVGWWRWSIAPPPMPWAENLRSFPTYKARLSENFEEHWNQSSQYGVLARNLRTVKKRCKDLTWRINTPGASEWTIRNWGAKWFPSEPHGMPQLQDRLLVAEYLEGRKQHYTHTLHDGDKIVAAITVIVHQNELVHQLNHRDSEYDRHGVMHHLTEIVFTWGKDTGFRGFDMGGRHDEEKKRWAPPRGETWEFNLAPKTGWLEQRITRLVHDGPGWVARKIRAMNPFTRS